MYPGGYTAEITSLSPRATEKDIYNFFAYCGPIEHVEIIRSGEYACTAYVTFGDPYALETAILLSGATIVDQSVCISRWGTYVDESDIWSSPLWRMEENYSSVGTYMSRYAANSGEAVSVAQEVVKTMLAKGYVLGKDALIKAKAFDNSFHLSATAAGKVAELSNRIGLTEKIYTSMETVRSADEKYHFSDFTKSAVLVTGTVALTAAKITGKTAAAAATAFVNSSYFAKGALWVSDALARAAKSAADIGSHGGQ